MPIGLSIASIAIGGIQALANFALQNRARNEQMALGRESLDFQKDQAREGRELATSTRTDAYGNEVSYDNILKKWNVTLTPQQEAILRAGEREQLLSLTEDAERNRNTARRAERRAVQADDIVDLLMAEYQYQRPPSEGAIRDELSGLLATTNQVETERAKDILGGQALRTNNSAALPGIIAAFEQAFPERVAQNELRAREGARAESASRNASHENIYQNAIRALSSLSQSVPAMGQHFSATPGQTQNVMSQAIAQLMNAVQSGSAGVGNAYAQLTSAAGNAPQIDLSGIQSGLSNLGAYLDIQNAPATPNELRFMDLGDQVVGFDPFTGELVSQYGYTPYRAPSSGGGGGGAAAQPPEYRTMTTPGGSILLGLDPLDPYNPQIIWQPPADNSKINAPTGTTPFQF